jgi:hypothetical protein
MLHKRLLAMWFHNFTGVLACLFLISSHVNSTEKTLSTWHRSFDTPQVRDFIELAISKSADKYPGYTLQRTQLKNKEQAFHQLTQKGQLDIIVTGFDIDREQNALPIYIPLDRGLLGFRTCLIEPQSQPIFENIQTVNDFALEQISMGVGSNWADKKIMSNNDIPLLEASDQKALMALLRHNKVTCISRSVIEMDATITDFPEFTEENLIAFVYPFGKIIYVNQHNQAAYEMLKYGLEKSIEDRSFHQLFKQHFAQQLEKHEFYFRKILLMKNPFLSKPAIKAINQFGIASFSQAGN